jgi:undecaprenyl pyrophosphate phosphatase UppP
MIWNALHSVLFGLISGFAQILPVSAEAHQMLFGKLTGAGPELVGFRFVCRLAALAAILMRVWPNIRRMLRERRLLSVPPRRRRRQPDPTVILDMRVLKSALIPMALLLLLYIPLKDLGNELWSLALLFLANGLILHIPQYFRTGNKDSRTMAPLDVFLCSVGGGVSAVPGISFMAGWTSVSQLRGADRQYALNMGLMLLIPVLLILTVFDFYLGIVSAAFSAQLLLLYLLCAAAAFAGTYFGILFLRFLAVRVGFSGFAYYSWGAALFAFILYLTI